MKKIIIAIVVLLIGAAAASPFLIGSQIEKSARQQVDLANEQLVTAVKSSPQFSNASIEIKSYEKGYLNSKAQALLSVSLNLPGEPETKVYEVPLNTVITHGPYLGDAGFGAAKMISHPDLSSLDLPDAINNDTFTIENLVSFSGDMDQKATVAPIKYDAEGTLFDFAGATITSNANLENRSTFTGLMDVKQLTVSGEDEPNQFVLKPFKMDVKGKGDDKKMEGDYEAKSGVIEATIGDEASIVMQSLSMAGTYSQAKGADMMIGDAKGVFKDIVFTNKELSPDPIKLPELTVSSLMTQPDGTDLDVTVKYAAVLDSSLMAIMQSPVDVKTADLEVTFKALPIEAIQKYQNLMQDLSTAQDDDKVAEKMQSELFSIMQMLIKNATATHLELHAKSDAGDLNADIDAGFKPGLDLSEQELMMLMGAADPQQILSVLVGRGHIDLNKGITDKAGVTPMIQIMAADFVTLEGDLFKSDIQITDGQLLVNGSPLPFLAPPAPAAPAMDAPMAKDEDLTDVTEALESDVAPESEQKSE
jgi:uncharacterized protein YdgA (DUF945 family)